MWSKTNEEIENGFKKEKEKRGILYVMLIASILISMRSI